MEAVPHPVPCVQEKDAASASGNPAVDTQMRTTSAKHAMRAGGYRCRLVGQTLMADLERPLFSIEPLLVIDDRSELHPMTPEEDQAWRAIAWFAAHGAAGAGSASPGLWSAS